MATMTIIDEKHNIDEQNDAILLPGEKSSSNNSNAFRNMRIRAQHSVSNLLQESNIERYLPTSYSNSISNSTIGWKKLGSDLEGYYYYATSGHSVAISGDGSRVAIGGPDTYYGRGKIFVYDWDANTEEWEDAGFIEGVTGDDEAGFSLDMSDDGSKIAVGAPGHSNYYGAVRVYEIFEIFPGFYSWFPVAGDIDGDDRGEAGYSVSISGNGERVAVGSPESFIKAGYTAIYELYQGSWIQLGLQLIGGGYYNFMGSSISLNYNGTRVIIASPTSGSVFFAGDVAVYEYDGVLWNEVGTASDLEGTEYYDRYGDSVDIDDGGDRIVIGALNAESDGDLNNGLAQIFHLEGDTWVQVGGDIYGATNGEGLGDSISITGDGTRIIVGSAQSDAQAFNSGQVRVFDYDDTEDDWVQVGRSIIGECFNDASGTAVGISNNGNRVIVGSPLSGEYYNGQARVFEATPDYEVDDSEHCFDFTPTLSPTRYPTNPPGPSAMPSTVPSQSPTLSPSDLSSPAPSITVTSQIPTQSPSLVIDDSCLDSSLNFAVGGGGYDCSILEIYQQYCDDSQVASHCPNTCDQCDQFECSDSEMEFMYANSSFLCSSLLFLPPSDIEYLCSLSGVTSTCRATCGYCETFPSESPTQTPSEATESPTIFFDDYDYYYDDDTTQVPSESPFSSPLTCTDSTLNFAGENGQYDCTSLLLNLEFCDDPEMSSHCPNTCEQCDLYACSDSLAPFIYDNDEYSCADLTFLPVVELDFYCALPGVLETCREICDFCD